MPNLEYIAGGLTILTLFVTVVAQFFGQRNKIDNLILIQQDHEIRLKEAEDTLVKIEKEAATSEESRKNMERILQENRNDIKFLTKEITAISGMLSIIVKDKS